MGNLAQSETVGGYRIRQRLRSQQFVLRDGYWVSPGLEPIRDALCDTQTELVDKQLRAQEARRRRSDGRLGEPVRAAIELDGIEVLPDEEQTPCPKERPDETCRAGWHSGIASRRCPLIQYSTQREQLADALELAGYSKGRDALTQPVHQVLLAKWSEANKGGLKTDYPGPGEALHRAHELAGMGFGSGYHLLMHGGKGLGKTRIGLALLFWALWDGKRACRVSWADLVKVANGQSSYDANAQTAAEMTIDRWRKQALILFDDLGTRDERENERAFATLGSFLDNYSGQIVATTNLRGATGGDAFIRAQDRLMATREVKGARLKAVAVAFDGPSQRRV